MGWVFFELSFTREENQIRLKKETISVRLFSATLAPTIAPRMLKMREIYGPMMGRREKLVPSRAATMRPKITPMARTKISLVGRSARYMAIRSEKRMMRFMRNGAAHFPKEPKTTRPNRPRTRRSGVTPRKPTFRYSLLTNWDKNGDATSIMSRPEMAKTRIMRNREIFSSIKSPPFVNFIPLLYYTLL